MKKATLGMIALAFAATLVLAPSMINAQQNDPRNQTIAELKLDNADVRDALKLLFGKVGVSYSVAPDVQGLVTCNLKDVPFETALRNLLNQVNATYRIEGGIYNVIVKPDTSGTQSNPTNETPATEASKPIRKIRLYSADPSLIIAILNNNTNPQSTFPEITLNPLGGGGFGGGGGGFSGGGGGFSGGGGGFSGGGGGFSGGGGGFGGGGFGGGGFGGGGGGFGGGGGMGGGGFGGGGFGR